jgi:hypothetical protein
LAVTDAALVILAVLAGCASMTVVDIESVTGPKEVMARENPLTWQASKQPVRGLE